MSNKCIYQPKGAAAEYGRWACNLYNGCTHGCNYCYCKRGVFASVMGGDNPVLKSSVGKNTEEAFRTFYHELQEHKQDIIDNGEGLFFSFSTDPFLREEIDLTMRCVQECIINQVPVKILTKATWWMLGDDRRTDYLSQLVAWRNRVTIGVTLTGHDELEPHASTNRERIMLLSHLLNCGIHTFVSLEPVVDFNSSLEMILNSLRYTAEYRIGLLSPLKKGFYNHDECERFCRKVTELSQQYGFTVQWKESIRKFYEDGLPLFKLMEKSNEIR